MSEREDRRARDAWGEAERGEADGAPPDPTPLSRSWVPGVPSSGPAMWSPATRAYPYPYPGYGRGPLPPHSPRHLALAGGLFLLTVAATYLTWGPFYSAAIMAILLSHEMGHYLMCRRYRVRSTLPLFGPLPWVSPFGTVGAVILMRQVGRDRRELFDIGIAGPLAGMVPALFAAAWGLAHSTVIPVAAPFHGLQLGDSLLFALLQKILLPGVGPDQEVILHPVAYAGWAGFFVTALNMLPVGQLDGGHVVYGMLGRRSVYVSLVFLGALVVLALFNPQWWLLVALLAFVVGPRHRPVQDESIGLDRKRVALGILALALLVLCFTPEPFEVR